MTKNIKRLNDRGVRHNIKNYRKKVFHDVKKNTVITYFNDLKYCKLYNNNIKGLKYFQKYQPVKLLNHNNKKYIVTYGGLDFEEIIKKNITNKNKICKLIRSIYAFLTLCQRERKVQRKIKPHIYIKRFISLCLDNSNNQIKKNTKKFFKQANFVNKFFKEKNATEKIGWGIIDPSASNFTLSSDKKISIVDLDHFTKVNGDEVLGYLIADIDCLNNFKFNKKYLTSIIHNKNLLSFCNGFLARCFIEIVNYYFNKYHKKKYSKKILNKINIFCTILLKS